MARRFVTYNTEDAEKLGIDSRGTMVPGDTKELPTDPGTYKALVTDGSGNWVAADRLAYTEPQMVTFFEDSVSCEIYASSGSGQTSTGFRIEEGVLYNITAVCSRGYTGTFVGSGYGIAGSESNRINVTMTNEANPSEYFSIGISSNNVSPQVLNVSFSNTDIIEITCNLIIAKEDEVVHPIDEKLIPDSVIKTNEQVLTETQQMQARKNLDLPYEQLGLKSLLDAVPVTLTNDAEKNYITNNEEIPVGNNPPFVVGTKYHVSIVKGSATVISVVTCSSDFYTRKPVLKARVSNDETNTATLDISISDDGAYYVFKNEQYNTTQTYTVSISVEELIAHPLDPKFLPKAESVADAAGETPTAAEFNALIAALKNAGYMS